MSNELRDVTGSRGEKIVELCLTDYQAFEKPLFRPGFLGDKWPAIDYYVELTEVYGKRLYFFCQVKSTRSELSDSASHLNVSVTKSDVDRLLRIPGPTYFLGVHEPTKRVFVRSIHTGTPIRGISQISLANELTSSNLWVLHQEVRDFWAKNSIKPTTSKFG